MNDLALGELTHAEAATKYRRTLQAVHQFSARNHAEIATRRQALLGEVDIEAVHLWVSNKVIRIAHRQKLAEGLERYLADDDLDPKLIVRLTREYNALLRAVAEEKGELRSTVELESAPLTHIVEGWNPDRWMQQLLERAGETAAEPYVSEARAPESAPVPEPAAEPEPEKHHSPVRFLS